MKGVKPLAEPVSAEMDEELTERSTGLTKPFEAKAKLCRKTILEAALLAAADPLSMDRLLALFNESDQIDAATLRSMLVELAEDCQTRSYELKQVASGYRFQIKAEYSPWLVKLWDEKPAKYSRAVLETLALIAYRQPVTRAEIEDIRGVTGSSAIIKTLMDREWIRIVGHRDVPGRPGLYATTKTFLDYFNLKNLDELPTLAELDFSSAEPTIPEMTPIEMFPAAMTEAEIMTAETAATEITTREMITNE